jgi:23S rRNA pseudouridine1911/1915/1917 synthase
VIYDDVAPDSAAGERLDAFLARVAPTLSRARAKSLIDDGHVLVDGHAGKPKQRLKGGERVVARAPEPKESELLPEDIPLEVLFEDDHLVVLNKPAGLAVHPGAGHPNGTLANALRHHYPKANVGGALRPGLVHRLDLDTSGVMVVALDDETHEHLSGQFRDRSVEKRYTAFTVGVPKETPLDLVTGHARDPRDRRRFTAELDAPEGELEDRGGRKIRRAHSVFHTLRAGGGVAELDVEIKTGRTHQIRAHAAAIGHPIVGDALYGGDKAARGLHAGTIRRIAERFPRQALHARVLAFAHPHTGERLRFEAPLPPDIAALAEAVLEESPT